MQQAQGDLATALTSYQAALAIGERLAKADPGNAGWQRDLSVSHARSATCSGPVGEGQGLPEREDPQCPPRARRRRRLIGGICADTSRSRLATLTVEY